MTTRTPPQHGWLGPGETARRLGVSVKALRVYEAAGLVIPERREGGWRHYGPACLERLHCVLALKALGLSLADIRALIDAPGTNLASVLELQARALSAQLLSARERLEGVREAQREIAERGSLSTEALLALSRHRAPIEMGPAQVLVFVRSMAVGAAPFDRRTFTASDEQAVAALVSEASRLAASACIPASREAAALAEQWDALAQRCAARLDPSAPRIRSLADDLLTSRALAPALAFLREALAHRRKAAVVSKES